MKKTNNKNSGRYAVEIDAEQMKYIRHYHELSGKPIAGIVRGMVDEWIQVTYPVHVRKLEEIAKAGKKRLAARA